MALHEGLSQQPAAALVSTARAALAHLETAQEREKEYWRLREIEARFNAYLAAWEPLWDAARERGIEIGQTMGQDDWSWKYQGREGRAPTPGEALLAALEAPTRGTKENKDETQ